MKNMCLLTMLCLLPLLVAAQTVTVSEQVVLREDSSYDIFGDDRGNLLLFRDRGTEFKVQGFDANLRLSWEKDIELDRRNPIVEAAVPAPGGGFSVIYQHRNKAYTALKIHLYSPAANLTDSCTIAQFEQPFFTPSFDVVLSEDKNVALLWYVREQREINALAFDIGQMRLLWQKAFQPEDMLLARDFLQAVVDNEGNMYFLLEKDNFPSRQRSHYLEVLDFGPGTGESLRRYTVPMGEYLTYDVKFAFDNLHKRLIAGGLYAADNPSRAEGAYFLRLDPARPDSALLRFHAFDDAFVAVLNEREKGRNRGIPESSVQQLVLRTDGGFILVGEANKEFQRGAANASAYSRTGFRPIIDYYYDDVFLISLHPDGSLHWKEILHKKQYSQDDNAIYSSFFLAKMPSALRFVFNDDIKHECTVSEYVVRGNGSYDRNAVLSTERKELQLRFRDAVQLSAYEFVVPSERRGRLKLVRIDFKQEK